MGFNPLTMMSPESFGIQVVHIQSTQRNLLQCIAHCGEKHMHDRTGQVMYVISIRPENFLTALGGLIQNRVFFNDFSVTKRNNSILVELVGSPELSTSEVRELESIVRSGDNSNSREHYKQSEQEKNRNEKKKE